MNNTRALHKGYSIVFAAKMNIFCDHYKELL